MNLTPVLLGSASFVFLNFSLPIYTRSTGADAVEIGALYSVFTITMLVLRPLVGWLLDAFGRRWFFACAFLFYAGASGVFSLADSLSDFYLARFLQGIGASLMWVSARTMIADVTAQSERGSAMGRLTSRSVQGSMLGAVYGFTLLGMAPLKEAWQAAFAGYAAIALLGFLLAVLKNPETRPAGAVSRAPGQRFELGVPLRRLLVIVLLSNFASALIEPIYLIYLQDKFELSIEALAAAFFPAGIVYAVLPRYLGGLGDRFGRTRLIAAGVSAAALVSMLLPFAPGILAVAVLYTLFAAGWAAAGPSEDALVGDLSSEELRGRVFGVKEGAASFGAALGPLVGGAVYEYGAPELAFFGNGLLLLVTVGLVLRWLARAPGMNTTAGSGSLP